MIYIHTVAKFIFSKRRPSSIKRNREGKVNRKKEIERARNKSKREKVSRNSLEKLRERFPTCRATSTLGNPYRTSVWMAELEIYMRKHVGCPIRRVNETEHCLSMYNDTAEIGSEIWREVGSDRHLEPRVAFQIWDTSNRFESVRIYVERKLGSTPTMIKIDRFWQVSKASSILEVSRILKIVRTAMELDSVIGI